ncbi:hypothetical protein ABIE56_000738 [Luteibacter sp. 621]|jgi:hypothetical protein|uniref:hypothetical protein n=1 Tax=Luteibacter sp. 621 TaxID=3373916 RepID=UPI003D2579CC
MTGKSRNDNVLVTSEGSDKALTKEQKSFNTLIGKINKRRDELAAWQAFEPEFQAKYHGEYVPSQQAFVAIRIQLVQCLDQAHDAKGLTKADRQTIEDLILYVAGGLLTHVDDPALAEIYRRYEPPAAEADAAAKAELQAALAAAFGTESPDEFEFDSPEELFNKLQEELEKLDAQERAEGDAREEAKARRRADARRAAAQERARTEQAEAHLSLRDVYRRLASALHPDRETDPIERERKAMLMQRVNLAYASKSLLDLLELQLELEHIDKASLANVTEDRLKRWNATLREQLRNLDMELDEVTYGFAVRSGIPPHARLSTKGVMRQLSQNILSLREFTKACEYDMRVFDDPKRLKPWLKRMKQELLS